MTAIYIPMKAHKTQHEIASMPITELLTYKHETLAYDMKEARLGAVATLLEVIYFTKDNIISGCPISNSIFFNATNDTTNCDTYPN